MGRNKRQGKSRSITKFEKLSSNEHNARRIAERLRLFLLFEGHGKDRIWRIYDTISGKVVGFYNPSTKHYHVRGREGWGMNTEEVMRLAAEGTP